MKFVYIYNLDDVVEHIKNNETGVTIRFITEKSLVRMLFEMVKRQYIPDVNYENKKINSLYFKVGKIKYSIQHSINEDDTEHSVIEDEYKI